MIGTIAAASFSVALQLDFTAGLVVELRAWPSGAFAVRRTPARVVSAANPRVEPEHRARSTARDRSPGGPGLGSEPGDDGRSPRFNAYTPRVHGPTAATTLQSIGAHGHSVGVQ